MTLKIYVYPDRGPSKISSPLDHESCETAVRSLKGMSIYTIESSKWPILRVQSVCAIFGPDYNTFYIETEISALSSSQYESRFSESTLSGGGFKRKEFFFTLDNSGEFNFDAKNPYFSR